MIDAHTHLAVCEPDDAELVATAAELGVTKMLTVGTDAASSRVALDQAQRFVGVYAAVGHHPNNAGSFDTEALAALAAMADHPKCRAIGETGFDFFRDRSGRDEQERAFLAHIELARATQKPLVIHTRDADDATIALLTEHAADITVLLHCFSMPSRLRECEERGWWFSFAGNCTYPKNAALADAARRAPADRLLVETDAPYLTPQPVRKHRNQPAFVTHTARFVAELRGTSYEELEQQVEANAARLFGW